MKSINNHEVALNLTYYKWILWYNVFDPNGKKIFNYNLSHFIGFIIIIFVQCSIFFGTWGFFWETKNTIDITAQMTFWFFMITNISCTLKYVVFIYKATETWNLLNVVKFKFLKSRYCFENIRKLKDCKTKISQFSNYVFCFLSIIFILWVIYPLVTNTNKKFNENPNEFYKNILSLRYPVTINTYNQYFYFFYVVEFGIITYFAYNILVDNFVICICLIIATQYKILTQAFINIGRQEKHYIDDKINSKIIS